MPAPQNYTPRPIDTSNVQLSDDVCALLERLAMNTHEVWAKQRLSDGWTWGPQRNDEAKHHPCLIPYDELPESEKQYDRTVSADVLKAIIALGFKIERSE